MPKKDKNLQKEYFDEWYAKNREKKNAYARQRYDDRNDLIRQIKRQECSDCGIKYPAYVMDFDHVRGEKKFNLSKSHSRSWKDIFEESKKCDIVCANCHRIRTHLRWCQSTRQQRGDSVCLHE
jgi:hypothetical protein